MSNARRGIPLTKSHIDKIFPKLTPAQISRIAAIGQCVWCSLPKYLLNRESVGHIFVIVSGELRLYNLHLSLRLLLPFMDLASLQAMSTCYQVVEPLFKCVPYKPCEVIELDRQYMMHLVQTDAEIGDIIIRAFILRRIGLWPQKLAMLYLLDQNILQIHSE